MSQGDQAVKPTLAARAVAVLCLAGALSLGACNTIKGAGTDIKKTGNAIENTAEKAKP